MAGFTSLFLNLILPDEIEDEETPEYTADDTDKGADEEEWRRIEQGKSVQTENSKKLEA